ncbi:MAG TPA: hypothetical protein VEH58_06880 [Dehalococcoidales bacterium]|nr:hypothetical protein [Dehalococcoidales bacterium]
MNIFHTIFATRLVLVLGFVNLLTGFLLLFTCRIIPAFKFTRRLMTYSFYKNFYKYHAWLWAIFWVSVIVHVIFAVNLMGWPF